VSVEVRDEVDGFAIDVAQQVFGQRGEPRFGVPVGRRGVAVDRAEIPLAVDQRVAEREILNHADHRVVDRAVAVGVIVLDHLADDTGGFRIRTRRQQPLVVHRVEDAAMDRFQTVADVRERAAHDDRHRIREERGANFVLDVYGDGAGSGGRRRCSAFGILRR
jgi:hypothetical protein